MQSIQSLHDGCFCPNSHLKMRLLAMASNLLAMASQSTLVAIASKMSFFPTFSLHLLPKPASKDAVATLATCGVMASSSSASSPLLAMAKV